MEGQQLYVAISCFLLFWTYTAAQNTRAAQSTATAQSTGAAQIPVQKKLQKFTIHRQEDCSDTGESYSRSVRNLKRVSTIVACGAMRCFCNHHGMWSFSTYKNFRRTFQNPLKTGSSLMELNGTSCESRKLNWKFVQLGSIRHLGNSDTSIRTLSLYRYESFLGPELRMTGTRLSLPFSLRIKSYGFTGGKCWSLFQNSNFGGNVTCIRTPPTVSRSLLGHNSNFTLNFGAVYFLCPKSCKNGTNQTEFKIPRPQKFIILFTRSNGNESFWNEDSDALYFSGTELQLPFPQVFVEFSIGQNFENSQNFENRGDKWTIYEGVDFNGKSRCLATFGQSSGLRLRRYRFRRSIAHEHDEDFVDFGETWLIGSIRFGCFSNLLSDELYVQDYEDTVYDDVERQIKTEVDEDDTEFFRNSTRQNSSSVPDLGRGTTSASKHKVRLIFNLHLAPFLNLAFPLLLLKL